MGRLLNRRKKEDATGANISEKVDTSSRVMDPIPIPAGDPLETVLLSAGGPVEVQTLELASPAVRSMKEAGVELVVPLIGQGELLGVLSLGRRLSDQPYSTDDRRLLGNLASQVAPAMKVAQLIREQQAEAEERERIQHELKVAALIQQTLLPKELPTISGWGVDAFYRPAREVGGDFYDFIDLGRGRLGVIIGDVTDKGVPAALVMATCRSMLRAAAGRHDNPSEVLQDVNEILVLEIPPSMFVTCIYAIIDTRAGDVVFANAGHNLPYVRTADGVIELRATGMPLGLMPGMSYDEKSYSLSDGDVMVLTSDGITEAHNPQGEMFGFQRVLASMASRAADADLVFEIVDDLEKWAGPGAEQEDDITLVVIRRTASAAGSAEAFKEETLASFAVASVEGNEREAIDKVAKAVAPLNMPPLQIDRLKTAVGEAVMNAIEHGNEFNADLGVDVEVLASPERVVVRVADDGGDKEVPDAPVPDLEAKLSGEQAPRGWGLFLIDKMVDEVIRSRTNGKHIVELVVNREGAV